VTDIEWSVSDGVATLVLNRPARRNAFTYPMLEEWARLLRQARRDPQVRVIVVTGAEGAFCSGVDLGEFADRQSTVLERRHQLTDHVHEISRALEDLDKPVIAAINGVAVGAGLDMALMCDLRVAARSARLGETYIRVGLVPGDGGAYWLPRIVGLPKALELLLTGDIINADEALRIGLVNRVVPDNEFAAAVAALARQLADSPALTLSLIKRATYESARSDLRTSLDLIASHMAVITSTDDQKEALAAFQEKRRPVFHGR
jgi:enoyl-CoA hydratase/carnithine racemase